MNKHWPGNDFLACVQADVRSVSLYAGIHTRVANWFSDSQASSGWTAGTGEAEAAMYFGKSMDGAKKDA